MNIDFSLTEEERALFQDLETDAAGEAILLQIAGRTRSLVLADPECQELAEQFRQHQLARGSARHG